MVKSIHRRKSEVIMGTKEDKAREAIKAKYGSVPKMAEATGIPKTTIYHALDRGLDNTTTRVRTQIEYALIDLHSIDDNETDEQLTDDERELLTYYRQLSTKGKHAVLAGLRDFVNVQ